MTGPWHDCPRGARYSTKILANTAVREQAGHGVEVRVFKCFRCGGYHLAQKRRKSEARR